MKPSSAIDSGRIALSMWLVRFGRARRGNIALIFALALLPILMIAGGAIDFGMAISNKASIQDAADAAALAGAQAANTYLSLNGTGTVQLAQAVLIGNSTAQNAFNANVHPIGNETTPTITTSTTITSGAPTMNIAVHGVYTPFLLKLAGVNSLPLNINSATTMSPANSYFQIIFVVDVSGSMSIGGDSPTIATLQAKGAFACAFACHDPTNAEGGTATSWCNSNPADTNCRDVGPTYCPWGKNGCTTVYSTTMTDKRALAKLYGYNLKIDYVNSAIQDFMTQLAVYNVKYPGRYTVGIDTFGTSFTVLQAPTTNITTATTAASQIDVEGVKGPVGVTNWGYTYTTVGLTNTISHLANVGDGSSTSKMRTFVVFLTDAVEDIPGNQIYGRGADLNYGSVCTSLKNAGVSLFTIWAPYYPIPGDIQYATLIAPLSAQMPTVMQGCASSASQYFQANDGPGITAAVNSTFNNIINNSHLRITN